MLSLTTLTRKQKTAPSLSRKICEQQKLEPKGRKKTRSKETHGHEYFKRNSTLQDRQNEKENKTNWKSKPSGKFVYTKYMQKDGGGAVILAEAYVRSGCLLARTKKLSLLLLKKKKIYR